MPRPLEIINVLGSHIWLASFHRTFTLCSLNLLQAPFYTCIYLSVLFLFVFPLLEDKQNAKFDGV